MYIYFLAKANSCVNRTLVAKTEGSISGILTDESFTDKDAICSIKITNIPEYSVAEFTMNRYNCKQSCCDDCHYIKIQRGTKYHEINSSSTTPRYASTNVPDIFIEPSFNAVIRFKITYRGE